ncbi:MAG: hypothetical protein H5U21_06305 [Porphyrobacter sp.]|nr:hypothetical protein [Porphyrobacter sp.]
MNESTRTDTMPVPGADALLTMAMQPWLLAVAAHDAYLAWCRSWAQFCLCGSVAPHPHEPPEQLEVPDPIEAEGEDLFA